MRVPCEASTSQPASAPSTRAWRQPGRALQQPWAGALRAARRMRQRQQHTVASAAQDEFAPTKWSPQRDRLADYLPVPAEDSKPAPRRPGYHAFVMVSQRWHASPSAAGSRLALKAASGHKNSCWGWQHCDIRPLGPQLPLADLLVMALQDKCEFLVAETPDGQLDLSDVFLLDGDSDVFARPIVYGEVPAGPRHYQIVEVRPRLGNIGGVAASGCTGTTAAKRYVEKRGPAAVVQLCAGGGGVPGQPAGGQGLRELGAPLLLPACVLACGMRF